MSFKPDWRDNVQCIHCKFCFCYICFENFMFLFLFYRRAIHVYHPMPSAVPQVRKQKKLKIDKLEFSFNLNIYFKN